MVVPESMSYASWIELFEIADYLSLPNAKNLIVGYLETLIDERSVINIFHFS